MIIPKNKKELKKRLTYIVPYSILIIEKGGDNMKPEWMVNNEKSEEYKKALQAYKTILAMQAQLAELEKFVKEVAKATKNPYF